MKKKLYNYIFYYFGNRTPESWGRFREFLIRGYIQSAGHDISIGRYSRVHKSTVIGDRSGIGRGCEINKGVVIGNDVMMGPDVLIYTQNHGTAQADIPMRMQGMMDVQQVTIEDDVWIGARVCILPGVTIGKGAVIGAYAVVSKDIPPYSVAVGNPARIVKTRKEN